MSSKSDNRKTMEVDFSDPEIEQIQDRRIEGSFSTDPDASGVCRQVPVKK